MQETEVQSLGWEDPLVKGMASILAWRIPWTEEPAGWILRDKYSISSIWHITWYLGLKQILTVWTNGWN